MTRDHTALGPYTPAGYAALLLQQAHPPVARPLAWWQALCRIAWVLTREFFGPLAVATAALCLLARVLLGHW